MQQDHCARWFVGDARIQYRGRRVAAARFEDYSLFGQLAAANPPRAENHANDARDRKSGFPPFWLSDIHFAELGACPATIPERMIELLVCGFPAVLKEEREIGGCHAK